MKCATVLYCNRQTDTYRGVSVSAGTSATALRASSQASEFAFWMSASSNPSASRQCLFDAYVLVIT